MTFSQGLEITEQQSLTESPMAWSYDFSNSGHRVLLLNVLTGHTEFYFNNLKNLSFNDTIKKY